MVEGAGRGQGSGHRPHGLGCWTQGLRPYAGRDQWGSHAGWDTGSRPWLAGASGQRRSRSPLPRCQDMEPARDSGQVWKVLGDLSVWRKWLKEELGGAQGSGLSVGEGGMRGVLL